MTRSPGSETAGQPEVPTYNGLVAAQYEASANHFAALRKRRHRGRYQRSLGLGRTGCDIFYTEAAQDSERIGFSCGTGPAAVPMQE